MTKNSKKDDHTASLKRRQVNGINEIAASRRDTPNHLGSNGQARANSNDRSLQDRMSPASTHREASASPRKRKRQKNKQHEGSEAEEDNHASPAAKRNKPDVGNKPGGSNSNKPRLWEHIKSKRYTSSFAKQQTSQIVKSKASQKVYKDVKTSKSSSMTNVRDSTPGGVPYLSPPSEKPPPAQRMQPVDSATAKQRQTCFNAFSPVVSNPDWEHSYREYDDNSIPILYSAHARGARPDVLLNHPSLELKCHALALLDSPKGFTANDLGRPIVPKKGPTTVIDDLDLYLMEDGKIHVGTERGLLLAADYLKLAGIPDTTPVRFNGTKPPYVKASPNKRFFRHVSTTTYDTTVPDRERPSVPDGDLPLLFGEMIEVWEVHPTNGRAFGKLRHGGQIGWFDWKHTVRTRKEIPAIPLWDDTVFEEKDFTFSKNDPPASAAALASLKYVKTYRCQQPNPPPGALQGPKPAVKSPFTPLKTNMPLKRAATSQPQTQPSPTSAYVPARVAKNDIPQVPSTPTDDEGKSMDCSSSEDGDSEEERNDNVVEEDKEKTYMQDGSTVPEISKNSDSQEKEVVKHEIVAAEDAASSSSSNKSSTQRSMHDHYVEDEVDWDDDEL